MTCSPIFSGGRSVLSDLGEGEISVGAAVVMNQRGSGQKAPKERGGHHCASSGAVKRAVAKLAFLLAVVAMSGAGCRQEQAARPAIENNGVEDVCQRVPNERLAGANVIDLADDKDHDAANDGERGFGSAKASATLTRLKATGLNAVLLPVVVTAPNANATSVALDPLARGEAGRLVAMIKDARKRRMAVALVPHLRLDDGQWRGRLEPDDLDAFFSSYTKALVHLARIAERHCVSTLSIGIELKALTKSEAALPHFLSLISTLRKEFKGQLTYSANWDEAESVPFWSALDVMGVNAFFPLSKAPNPDDAVLEGVAQSIVTAMDAFAREQKRPWWMMELGFKATPASYVEPWKWPGEVRARTLAVDERSQQRGYRAWFKALESAQTVEAVFFWMVPSALDDVDHPWAFEPAQGFSFVNKRAEGDVRAFAKTWTKQRAIAFDGVPRRQSFDRVTRKKIKAPTANTAMEKAPMSAPQTK